MSRLLEGNATHLSTQTYGAHCHSYLSFKLLVFVAYELVQLVKVHVDQAGVGKTWVLIMSAPLIAALHLHESESCCMLPAGTVAYQPGEELPGPVPCAPALHTLSPIDLQVDFMC